MTPLAWIGVGLAVWCAASLLWMAWCVRRAPQRDDWGAIDEELRRKGM